MPIMLAPGAGTPSLALYQPQRQPHTGPSLACSPVRPTGPLPHSGLPSPAKPRGHKRRADMAWTWKGRIPKPRGKLGLGAQLTLIFTTITNSTSALVWPPDCP